MSDKKIDLNSSPPPEVAEDMKKRFGAVAFIEDIEPETGDDLTLESLRMAFAALEDETEVETEEEFSPETEELEETAFSEEFSEEFAGFAEIDEMSVDAPTDPLEESRSIELSPKNIVEAMLFVGDRENRPLSADRAAEKMRNVTPEEIDRAVAALNAEYHRLGCPYRIQEEEDGYRMVLRSEFEPILEKFYGRIREARLSQQVIDTLAIVAYQQPITAEEVQKIRKQPSTAFLSQLVRRGLLETVREVRNRKKIVLYQTTERFLELFQLETIEDLPIAEEIDFR